MATKMTGIVNPVLSDEMTLSLDFGNTYSDGSFHKGVDVYSSQKRECYVIAPCSGTITSLCNTIQGTNTSNGTAGMGNYVYLQTSSGLRLRFQHMKYKSVIVKKGQTVKKGDKIGIIGNTGNSRGRHLHFDVSVSEKVSGGVYLASQKRTYFDPKPYLKGTKSFVKEQSSAVQSGKKYIVTASKLNVRKGPGTNYSVIKTLKYGTTVTVYETKNGFGRISQNSSEWVSVNYLTKA